MTNNKCAAGETIRVDQPCPRCGATAADSCGPAVMKKLAELDRLRAVNAELVAMLTDYALPFFDNLASNQWGSAFSGLAESGKEMGGKVRAALAKTGQP